MINFFSLPKVHDLLNWVLSGWYGRTHLLQYNSSFRKDVCSRFVQKCFQKFSVIWILVSLFASTSGIVRSTILVPLFPSRDSRLPVVVRQPVGPFVRCSAFQLFLSGYLKRCLTTLDSSVAPYGRTAPSLLFLILVSDKRTNLTLGTVLWRCCQTGFSKCCFHDFCLS